MRLADGPGFRDELSEAEDRAWFAEPDVRVASAEEYLTRLAADNAGTGGAKAFATLVDMTRCVAAGGSPVVYLKDVPDFCIRSRALVVSAPLLRALGRALGMRQRKPAM